MINAKLPKRKITRDDILKIIRDFDYQIIDQRSGRKLDIVAIIMDTTYIENAYAVIYTDFSYQAVPYFIDSNGMIRTSVYAKGTDPVELMNDYRYTLLIPECNKGKYDYLQQFSKHFNSYF